MFLYLLKLLGGIADRITSAGRGIEAVFHWILDRINRAGSGGRTLARITRPLTRPFRRLGAWFGSFRTPKSKLGRRFNWLLSPFFRLTDRMESLTKTKQKSVSRRDIKADEERLKQKLKEEQRQKKIAEQLSKSWVSRVGRVVLVPFRGSIFFFWQFLKTRQRALYLWGIPLALVFGLLASIVLIPRMAGGDQRLVSMYETAHAEALKANDAEKAKLYRLKLDQLGSATRRGEFRTAMALAEQGKNAEAYEIMQRLAPLDRPGLEGAHFWIAQNMVAGTLEGTPATRLGLALKHLDQLKARAGDEPEIRLLEGMAHARLGKVSAALAALQPIGDSNLVAAVLLMDLRLVQKERDLAREHALVVYRKLDELTDQGQTLSEEQLRWRSAATRVIGDQKLAAQAVEDWYKTNPESTEARVNRTRLLLVEVTNWCNNPQLDKLDEIKTRLLAAAETVPTDRAGAVGSVAVLIARNRGANPGLEALYQALLAEEKLPGVLLESFGTVAAVQEEWAKADELLGRAAEVMPDSALVWNNRAVAVRKGFPQRLEESLGYANRAVELEDGNADFRETRGMIHYNLGNYEAAIEDLEIALNGVNRLELVKTTLADCYRRLGNDALAELYEKQLARRQQ